MFAMDLKRKIIIFAVLYIPLLSVQLLYDYALWIPENSWFFNKDFLRVWFYIIFFSFIFVPFSEIILFKRGTFFQRFLLIMTFIFFGIDLFYYLWMGIFLDQVLGMFIFAVFLNFSSNLLDLSKFNLIKREVFNIILIIMGILLLVFNLFDLMNLFPYIVPQIFNILLIFSIIYYLWYNKQSIYLNDTYMVYFIN